MCDGSVSASVFFWHLCKLESKISRVPSADGTGPVPADPQARVRALDLARTLLPAHRAPELRLPLVVNAQGAFHRSKAEIRKQAYEHLILRGRFFLRNGAIGPLN